MLGLFVCMGYNIAVVSNDGSPQNARHVYYAS